MNYLANVLTSGLHSPRPTEAGQADQAFPSDEDSTTPSLGVEVSRGNGWHEDGNVQDGERSRRQSRIPKTRTVLRFAHPPPTTKHQQRLHIRPKILLQLQQTFDASRPRLVLDVVPSASYASHFAQRIPHHFSSKASHGADDLTIVSSHAQDKPRLQSAGNNDHEGENDTDKHRVVATIQRIKKGDSIVAENADIRLSKGLVWKASKLPSGSYEFSHLDKDGHRTVARWVPKRKNTKQLRAGIQNDSGDDFLERNSFTFSILDPNKRRHAVIARLNPDAIEIFDQYTTPPPLTPSASDASSHASDNGAKPPSTADLAERSIITVDDNWKTLIAITGVWVVFNEDFSPNSTHSQPSGELPNQSLPLGHKRRSVSLNFSNNHHKQSVSPKSPMDGESTEIWSSLQHTRSSATVPTMSTRSRAKSPPLRTLSLSGPFMQRTKDHRLSASNPPQLSTIPSFDDSTADVAPKHEPSCGSQESPSRTAWLPHQEVSTDEIDCKRVPSRRLRPTEENLSIDNTTKPPKRKGFGKVFGLHRRKTYVP
ncbi:MAG: hypothetical protein Q9163_005540 [Psora crenata]